MFFQGQASTVSGSNAWDKWARLNRQAGSAAGGFGAIKTARLLRYVQYEKRFGSANKDFCNVGTSESGICCASSE